MVRYGGSISGEHGDGQARGELLAKMYGPELIESVPRVQGDLGSRRQDEPRQGGRSLPDRLPTCASAPTTAAEVETQFAFPDDDGSFAHATLRCVGVGKCRAPTTAARCARATWSPARRSTRRAAGPACSSRCCTAARSQDGWRERARRGGAGPLPRVQGLQERLPGQRRHGDLQGRVPLALLRAGRLRPRYAYAMGLIHWWARARRACPGSANLLTQRPGRARGREWLLAGMPAAGDPMFAVRDIHRVVRGGEAATRSRAACAPLAGHVQQLLPAGDGAIAAVAGAGRRPATCGSPGRTLCCGRPLYDYGMLDGRRGCCGGLHRHSRRRSRLALPWSGSSRAASPRSATASTSQGCFPTTRRARG